MYNPFEVKQDIRNCFENLCAAFQGSDYVDEIDTFQKEFNSISEDNKIRIVICGDFSTGKSTIVKALTGNDSIKIAPNPETSESTEYEYKDCCIVDTPGLNTTNLEHTEKAKYAILHADRIIYCITAGTLFSSESISDFKNLIALFDTSNSVILAVTKFAEEEVTDDDYLDNIMKDIERQLTAQGISKGRYDIRPINAERYIQGMKDLDSSDEEKIRRAKNKINASYFDEFTAGIDSCSEGKSLSDVKTERQRKVLCEFIGEMLKKLESDCPISQTDDRIEKQKQKTDELEKKKRELKRQVSNKIFNLKDETCRRLYDDTNHSIENTAEFVLSSLSMFLEELQDQLFEYNQTFSIQIGVPSSDMQPKSPLDKFLEHFPKRKLKGEFAKGGKAVGDGITTLQKLSEPVQIGKKFHLFKKSEPIMSEIGGKETVLAQKMVKVFPKSGVEISKTFGSAATKLGKVAGGMAIVGLVLDTGMDILSTVSENRSRILDQQNRISIQKKINEELEINRVNIHAWLDSLFDEQIQQMKNSIPLTDDAEKLRSVLQDMQRMLNNFNDTVSQVNMEL